MHKPATTTTVAIISLLWGTACGGSSRAAQEAMHEADRSAEPQPKAGAKVSRNTDAGPPSPAPWRERPDASPPTAGCMTEDPPRSGYTTRFEAAEHSYQETFLRHWPKIPHPIPPRWHPKDLTVEMRGVARDAHVRFRPILRVLEKSTGQESAYWRIALRVRLGEIAQLNAERMKDIAPKILQLAPTPAYSHRELVKEAEHLEMLSEWEEASARREWEVALHEAQLHCIESSWTELAEAYLSKP